MATPTSNDINAFIQKHKTALIIAGVVLAILALSDSGEPQYPGGGGGQPTQNNPYSDPYAGGGGGTDPYSSDEQYEDWKRRQDQQDEANKRFADEVIREVQTCTKDDGTIVYDVPNTVDCEDLN
ncbi:MAG: hypothetical protein AAF337_01930 [Pseudomonadota bacterium]